VNLSGLFYSMKYEVPPILAADGGAIVNVSSVPGITRTRARARRAAAIATAR